MAIQTKEYKITFACDQKTFEALQTTARSVMMSRSELANAFVMKGLTEHGPTPSSVKKDFELKLIEDRATIIANSMDRMTKSTEILVKIMFICVKLSEKNSKIHEYDSEGGAMEDLLDLLERVKAVNTGLFNECLKIANKNLNKAQKSYLPTTV